jgi:hypothetical protein
LTISTSCGLAQSARGILNANKDEMRLDEKTTVKTKAVKHGTKLVFMLMCKPNDRDYFQAFPQTAEPLW